MYSGSVNTYVVTVSFHVYNSRYREECSTFGKRSIKTMRVACYILFPFVCICEIRFYFGSNFRVSSALFIHQHAYLVVPSKFYL